MDISDIKKLKTETLLRGAGDYDRDTILALIDVIEQLGKSKDGLLGGIK